MSTNTAIRKRKTGGASLERRMISGLVIDANLGRWNAVWIVLLFWLLGVYLLVNLRLSSVLSGPINLYLAQPLVWTTLSILSYLGWRFGLPKRPALNKRLIGSAALIGFFQVALFVIVGIISRFGYSPYGREALAVLGNLLYVGTMLVGIEMSRAYLVAVFSRGSRILTLLSVSLLFTMISIPLSRYASLVGGPSLFRFLGGTFLPAIAENLLASVLVLVGGPLPAIAYRGVLLAFEWLSPILPNLDWIVTAFVGTLAPAFGFLLIQNLQVSAYAGSAKDVPQRGDNSASWMLVLVVSVALLWFNTGLFGVRPTVVSGVSMNPTFYAGDVVITRDVPVDDIEVGDIIRYQRHGVFILHRVVEIQDDPGGTWFIAKGDANNVLDDPIPANEIQGKVIAVIPKIGWVGVMVRRFFEWIF